MTPEVGSRLGSYELLGPLGAGGMGEVYRARDTKLGREVAIKVLPDIYAADPERLARFQREAQVLASLNHPNIAAIYGLEDGDGAKALVLELVPGETLADRIARGPLPLDEAIAIARQIAAALEAAHEQGVVHRDLKPANVKVTPDGVVKVLDFGLAKLQSAAASPSSISPLTMSPTITSPVMVTGVGVLLGTAPYMSPEQTRGREADKRSDVWAFGCVLYEMLTGHRAFDGEDVAETMASVIKGEPDWTRLAGVPAPVTMLIRECLRRDPRLRIGDLAAATFALGEAHTLAGSAPVRSRTGLIVVGAAAATAGALAVAVLVVWLWKPVTVEGVTRTSLVLPESYALTGNGVIGGLSITPDGRTVVYIGDNQRQIFVRALNDPQPRSIYTGAPRGVFISSDGQWVGFFDQLLLRKVPIHGGPALTIAKVAGASRGATWLADGTILFATNAPNSGLMRVSAEGGTPTAVTTLAQADENAHTQPAAGPTDDSILFTVLGGRTIEANRGRLTGDTVTSIELLEVSSGRRTRLLRGGSNAHYVAPGFLVYVADGVARAVRFDPRTRTTVGSAVPLTDGAFGDFAVARNGTLVYVPGGTAANERALVWVDRNGVEEPIPLPMPRALTEARVSRDGTKIALDIRDQQNDIWIWDIERRNLARLTFDAGPDDNPVWFPDSRRIAFRSQEQNRVGNLFWQPIDRSGQVVRVTTDDAAQIPKAITPDGKWLIFGMSRALSVSDLYQVPLDGSGASPTPLMPDGFAKNNPDVSPDGRWIAYQSNESNGEEVYVQPYPPNGLGKWQVSTSGGSRPRWAPDGRRLYFISADGVLMGAAVDTTSLFVVSTPEVIIRTPYYVGPARAYDLDPKRERFLMIKEPNGNRIGEQLTLVQNWRSELEKLLPSK